MLLSYALNHLKQHKKQSLGMIAFMTFFTAVLLGIQISASSQKGMEQLQKLKDFGEWQIYINDWNIKKDKQKLTEEMPYTILYDCAHLKQEARYSYTYGYKLYSIEGDYERTLALHLTAGRLPQNQNEIVISMSELNWLGLNTDLNQSVTLSLKDGDRVFKLVGIIDYTSGDESKYYYPRYLIAPGNYTSAHLFLGGQQNNDFIDTLTYDEDNGNIIYRSDSTIELNGKKVISINMQQLQINQTLTGILILASLCGGLVMMNLSYASAKKREQEYVLLRGIGATKIQLYTLSLIETSIQFFCAVLLALPLSLGISLFFLRQISLSQIHILIPASMLVTTILLAAIITLYANFRPVSKAISFALIGSFDVVEETLINFHPQKLKKLRLKRLAFRHLNVHLKDTILMIILLSIALLICCTAISSIDEAQKIIINLGILEDKQNCTITRSYDDRLSDEELRDLYQAGIEVSLIDIYQADYLNNASITYAGNLSYTFFQNSIINFVPLTNDVMAILEHYHFTGRIPQNKNEVMINSYIPYLAETSGQSLMSDPSEKDVLQLTFNGIAYDVVGKADGMMVPDPFTQNRLIENYFPINYNDCGSFMIYFPSSFMPDYAVKKYQIIFMEFDNINSYEWIRNYFKNDSVYGIYTSVEDINRFITAYQNKINYASLLGSSLSVVLLIMCFVIHMQRITNDQEQINRYRLIGMTKKEMIMFYLWQGLLISCLSILITFFIVCNALTYFKALPLISMAGLALITMLTLIIFYMMPVLINAADHSLQNIHLKEGQ